MRHPGEMKITFLYIKTKSNLNTIMIKYFFIWYAQIKERKKMVLKAHRAPQFSKR
ncbi:hypothetical protein J6TS2_42600 [Heyndrickxia sporothermodurans]|nr:hypothetical protein J6TS2_42600 [Heyndrickxia sporothermodurans]